MRLPSRSAGPAWRSHPRTRLLLLTHVSHRTGLVIPVREIVRMARRRNVDVIVDIAQSWGQLQQLLPSREVEILTPEEQGGSGAVTSFRLRGKTSFEANVELARRLAEDYGIFTVARDGPVGSSCIRVTPSYFTTTEQLDKLVAAVRTLARA